MRKPEIIRPGPGQESVWDYPRPPRLEYARQSLRVLFAGETVASTSRGYRVLETSHPPVYYFPPEDVRQEWLREVPAKQSFCEYKGEARYFDLIVGERTSGEAAWAYLAPRGMFAPLKGYYAFYAGRVDACYVDDELAAPQPGNFYGGWITSALTGPFKGEPGSWGW